MSETNATLGWLIWSNEHSSWWKPKCCGYTKERAEAGLYTFSQASKLVADANRYIRGSFPNETMCHVTSFSYDRSIHLCIAPEMAEEIAP